MKKRTVRNLQKRIDKELKVLIKKIDERISLLLKEDERRFKDFNRLNIFVRPLKLRQFTQEKEKITKRIRYWRQVKGQAIDLTKENNLSLEKLEKFISEISAIIEKEKEVEK